uniref:Uncharacterized protein n=1 Tax=Bionectria ochroleuca TaxID=29856 RepID=A0A8H7N7F0_BIOOC
MYTSTSLGVAIALLGTASAFPAVENAAAPAITAAPVALGRRSDSNPSAPWVSVDDEGQPATTYTPHMATDKEGSTYLADAPPPVLTETVIVQNYQGNLYTSTYASPPAPTATNSNKQGGFTRCHNLDGDHAPLCDPSADSTLYKDTTYYVTWDPDYYNKTEDKIDANTTVLISLRLDYFNRTTQDQPEGSWTKLTELDKVPAAWGFSLLEVKNDYFQGQSPYNLTVTLMRHLNNSGVVTSSTAFNLTLERSRPTPQKVKHKIDNQDLIIALPVTFGSIVFLLIGICLWNRKTRRIQIGNIMGRRARGYQPGVGSARRMFGGRNKDEGIRLQDRSESPVFEYRDQPSSHNRHDSDLGSLVGTPVSTTFKGATARSNPFRDEIRRQDEHRGGHAL